MPIDLNGITAAQFVIIGVAIAAVDFGTGVYAALKASKFSWDLVATVLDTHVLKRVIPIGVPAFIAQTFPAGATHDVLWTTALGLLALYVAETVSSVTGNISGNSTPTIVGA